MGFFEKLFCKHNFVCYRNGSDANGFLSSFWVCTKCNKKHSKRGQAEVHASFIPGRNAPAYVSRPRNATAPSTHVGRPAVADPSTDLLNPLSPLNPANTVNDECDDRRKYDYFGSGRGVVVDDVGRPESCATRYDGSSSSSCSSSSSSSYDNDSSSSSCSSSSSDY